MNAMLCAVLAGDSGIIRALANHRADVNFRVKDLAQLGYFDGQTLLMVAAKTRSSTEQSGQKTLHVSSILVNCCP